MSSPPPRSWTHAASVRAQCCPKHILISVMCCSPSCNLTYTCENPINATCFSGSCWPTQTPKDCLYANTFCPHAWSTCNMLGSRRPETSRKLKGWKRGVSMAILCARPTRHTYTIGCRRSHLEREGGMWLHNCQWNDKNSYASTAHLCWSGISRGANDNGFQVTTILGKRVWICALTWKSLQSQFCCILLASN